MGPAVASGTSLWQQVTSSGVTSPGMTSPVATSPVLVDGPGGAVLDLLGLHGVQGGGRGWLLQGGGEEGLLEDAKMLPSGSSLLQHVTSPGMTSQVATSPGMTSPGVIFPVLVDGPGVAVLNLLGLHWVQGVG